MGKFIEIMLGAFPDTFVSKVPGIAQDCKVIFTGWLAGSTIHLLFSADCCFCCQHSAFQCFLMFGEENFFCEMTSKQSEAERIIWETPELVERFVPFLDPESTLALAQCHKNLPGILQGHLIWNQLIRRACPFSAENFVR